MRNVTAPAERPCIWRAKPSTSHPASSVTERETASEMRARAKGSARVLRREQRLGGAREEHLLARDAVEVAVRQAVALADERERLRAADLLRTGRQRQAGVRVLGRRAQAHRDAADRGADVGEAREVDRGEVRDRQPGQLLDGPDRGARAGGGRGAHHRGVARRERRGGLGGEEARAAGRAPSRVMALGRLRRGPRPRRIDLVSAEALPQVDVGVARHRDRGGAAAAGGHVHDGQRVGRPAAGVARAGVERGQDVAGQLVALRVGAGVEADEQDVLLARRRGLGRVDDRRGRSGSIQCAQLRSTRRRKRRGRPPTGRPERDARGIARAASAGRGRSQQQRSPFSARRHLPVQGISVIATRWSSACARREVRRPFTADAQARPTGPT